MFLRQQVFTVSTRFQGTWRFIYEYGELWVIMHAGILTGTLDLYFYRTLLDGQKSLLYRSRGESIYTTDFYFVKCVYFQNFNIFFSFFRFIFVTKYNHNTTSLSSLLFLCTKNEYIFLYLLVFSFYHSFPEDLFVLSTGVSVGKIFQAVKRYRT